MAALCPHCGNEFSVTRGSGEVHCPKCGASFPAEAVTETTIFPRGRSSSHPHDETLAGEPTHTPVPPPDGAFAGYDVLSELGRGGMGIVYKAHHIELDRTVALKVIIAGEDASEPEIARFAREAQAAARMTHPNIVPVYDVGHVGQKHYFTMAFVEGKTLGDFVAAEVPTLNQTVVVMRKVAAAINYAHERGVIHRDLKPGNVMVDELGEPHIMDFGLARGIQEESGLTRTGDVVGTPGYMSPEQAEGKAAELDERTDVWAMGVMLYELSAGQPPFAADSPMQMLMRILDTDPPGPQRISRKVPGDLDTIIMKCLDKDPERRYRTAGALADDLGRFLDGEAILAQPPSIAYRLGKKIARNKALSAAMLAALVALIAAGGIAWMLYGERVKSRARWGDPVVTEEFGGDSLDASTWELLEGEVDLREGRLHVTGPASTRFFFREKLSGNVAIEFDGMFENTDRGCDLTAILSAHEDKPTRNFYMAAFGSDDNKASTIRRGHMGSVSGTEMIVISSPSPIIAHGKWHHIRAEREGKSVRLFVDGEKVLEYHDFFPLASPAHNRVGIYSWGAGAQIDNLKIYRQKGALKVSAVSYGDKYFFRGDYETAIDEYRDVARNHPGTAEAAEARYKMGLAYVRSGKFEEARGALESVDHPDIKPYAQYGMVDLLIEQQRFDEAIATMDRLYKRHKDDELGGRIRLDYHNRAAEVSARQLRADVSERFLRRYVEEAADTDPALSEALMRIALNCRMAGTNGRAIDFGKSLIEKRPELMDTANGQPGYGILVRSYNRMGRPDLAIASFSEMQRIRPSAAAAIRASEWVGYSHAMSGDMKKARHAAEAKWQIVSGNIFTNMGFPRTAIIRLKTRTGDETLGDYTRARSMLLLAQAYLSAGRPDDALAAVARIREISRPQNSSYKGSYDAEARAFIMLGRPGSALKALETAAGTYGNKRDYADIWRRTRIIQVRCMKGDLAGAQNALRGKTETYRHYDTGSIARSCCDLAAAFEAAGDDARALEYYRRAREIAGDAMVDWFGGNGLGASARMREALIHVRSGEPAKAVPLLDELKPLTAITRDTLGAAHLRGEMEAEKLAGAIESRYPEECVPGLGALAVCRLVAAEKLAAGGMRAEARAIMLRIVEDAPQHMPYDYRMTVRLARRRADELGRE